MEVRTVNFDDDELGELDFGLDIAEELSADIINIGDELDSEELIIEGMPSTYLYVEGLKLIDQIRGALDSDDEYLPILPVYASKNGVDTFVTYVELTADNILSMQRFGLTVTLVREGKSTIEFDDVKQLLSIVKTLREGDTIDYPYDNSLIDNH